MICHEFAIVASLIYDISLLPLLLPLRCFRSHDAIDAAAITLYFDKGFALCSFILSFIFSIEITFYCLSDEFRHAFMLIDAFS